MDHEGAVLPGSRCSTYGSTLQVEHVQFQAEHTVEIYRSRESEHKSSTVETYPTLVENVKT